MIPEAERRTLARELSGAFMFFGALVAGAFVITALAYGVNWAWLSPELDRSRQDLETETAAHAAMLDEETALRAYLVAGDAGFLGPYTRAEVVLTGADKAPTSVGSIPGLTAAMVNTHLARARWRERWAKAVVDARSGDDAPSLVQGMALFDAYRGQQRLFAEGLARRAEDLSRRNQRVVSARVALELLVFIAILCVAVWQHRALHEGIVVPVAALLVHIRRIRDGQLDSMIDRGGPRELAELAAGLNEMVRALAAARQVAASRDGALREYSLRLRQILDASREFSESLNLSYVVGAVRESTTAIGGYARVIVWLMDDEQKRLVNAEATVASGSPDSAPVELGQGLAGRAAKSGRNTFEGAARQVRFSDSNIGPVTAIAIPLIVGARVVGALEARHADAQVVTTHQIEVLEMLATHAATAIESARLHEIVQERSQMDVLTRLFNRRRLEEDLDSECKRCSRYSRPLALVMLDVDHFKAFNDAHGHPQADTALQGVADVIAGSVRTTDTAYRYGGEEFCILLRETRAEDAVLFAERVRQRMEHRFAAGPSAGITASFGVAGFSLDAPTPRALVEAADAAMYEAKHAGRNRVVLSSVVPLVAPPPIVLAVPA